jgi:hypothetical protein
MNLEQVIKASADREKIIREAILWVIGPRNKQWLEEMAVNIEKIVLSQPSFLYAPALSPHENRRTWHFIGEVQRKFLEFSKQPSGGRA